MKTVHVAIIATVAAVAGVYLITRASRAVADGVMGAVDYVWNGPPDAPQKYRQLLADTRADNSMNPFVHNPNNVNPVDLVPAGYRVNQWGGLERIDSGGATGGW